MVDLAKWEATRHQHGSVYHQPHEVLVDLAPITRKRHALSKFSKENLFSSFPSSLQGGSIPLGDQVGKLFWSDRRLECKGWNSNFSPFTSP